MRVVPERTQEQVQFFARQVVQWSAHVDALGLPADTLDRLREQTAEARAALDAQCAAQLAARAATSRLRDATLAMNRTGAALLNHIHAVAKRTGTDAYVKAQVAPPKRPAAVGPPGQPTDFKTQVDALGVVTLTWRCPHVSRHGGTMYRVERSLDYGRSFVVLATVGKRRFADETLPIGAGVATYQVRAVRLRVSGPAAHVTVRFGVDAATRVLLETRRPRAA